MSTMPLTAASNSAATTSLSGRGRSHTVARMMLSNRFATVAMAVFLPLLVGAGTTLVALVWMMIKGYNPEVLHLFFQNSLVMPVILIIAFASTMYMFVADNLKPVMSMGFTRRDVWWAILQVAGINSLISTLVISVFIALEVVTGGYGVGWQVFSTNTDLRAFQLQGAGFNPAMAVLELIRVVSHWFAVLMTAQIAGAFLGAIRLRWGFWGFILAGISLACCALAITLAVAGQVRWDLGLGDLFHPYHLVHLETGSTVMRLNEGPAPIGEMQAAIDQGQMHPLDLGVMSRMIALSLSYILGFAAMMFIAGGFLLKKTDLR